MILITYFEKFVSNVQPSEERIAAISDSHTTVRKHLLEDAKLKFPIVDSLLSGSYARHTSIDPIKDADIILVLEETKVSDDKKTPNPRHVLEDLKAALDDFYDQVNLETQRRSIQVFLPEDDVRMDIVPSIAPDGKEKQLNVPDYEQGKWIKSHPYEHITFATNTNKENGGRFVRVAKAMKWWKIEKLVKEKAPKSFLLEVIVAYNMDSKASNLCEAFAGTLKNILSAYKTNRQNGTVPKVPDPALPDDNDLADTCGWTANDFIYFYDQVSALSDVAEKANDAKTSKDDTVKLWKSAFGDVYPASLTEEEERALKSASSQLAPLRKSKYPYKVKISARLARKQDGAPFDTYRSDGRKLEKGLWIRFSIDEINVPQPYEIKWTVRNHGREARERKQLFHQRLGGRENWETTAYTGHHFMDCEVLKNGRVVAMARHIVNIK
jgi:hypothetical protein